MMKVTIIHAVQYKRKVIANYSDSLVTYYLITCFDRAKLEVTVSEIARSALTTELMKSYLVKNNNKYDKKSLLFLLFHGRLQSFKVCLSFEKNTKKEFHVFCLTKKHQDGPSTPFKDFYLRGNHTTNTGKEDNIREMTVSRINYKVSSIIRIVLYVLIRKASDIDLLFKFKQSYSWP